MKDEPMMTEDEAEEIIMAHCVGRCNETRSRIAHAILLLEKRDLQLERESELPRHLPDCNEINPA